MDAPRGNIFSDSRDFENRFSAINTNKKSRILPSDIRPRKSGGSYGIFIERDPYAAMWWRIATENRSTSRPTHLAKVATITSRRLSPIIWGNILPGNSLLIGTRCNYERKRAASRATSAICLADPEDRQFLILISRCLNHLRTLRHALNNLIRQVSDICRWCALDSGTIESAVRYLKY